MRLKNLAENYTRGDYAQLTIKKGADSDSNDSEIDENVISSDLRSNQDSPQNGENSFNLSD